MATSRSVEIGPFRSRSHADQRYIATYCNLIVKDRDFRLTKLIIFTYYKSFINIRGLLIFCSPRGSLIERGLLDGASYQLKVDMF